jgi:hypothetical protein
MRRRLGILSFPYGIEVMDVNRPPLDNRSSADVTGADYPILGSGHRPKGRYVLKPIPIGKTDLRIVRVTEPRSIFSHGIEHWLNVRR